MKALEIMIPLNIDLGVHLQPRTMPLRLHAPAQGCRWLHVRPGLRHFYWPGLKAVLLGLIEEGLVPYVFVEGGYNTGWTTWPTPTCQKGSIVFMFDTTDMEAVKKTLGASCLAAMCPLPAGSPAQVEEYVKNLLERWARTAASFSAREQSSTKQIQKPSRPCSRPAASTEPIKKEVLPGYLSRLFSFVAGKGILKRC